MALKPLQLKQAALQCLGVLIAVAAAASFISNAAAGGVLLGGLAAMAAYGWLARQLTHLARLPPEELQLYSVRQAAARMAMYAVAITLAYRLDRENMYGVLGALAGYLAIRVVVTLIALRGGGGGDGGGEGAKGEDIPAP